MSLGRDLPAPLADAIDQPVVRPFLALRIELPDPVYVWTGIGSLQFEDADGAMRTWLGAGGVGALDTIGEATDGSATGIKATLLKIPSDFQMLDGTWVGDYLHRQAVRGVIFEVYVGAVDLTFQVVTGSHLLWKGRLDQYKITDAGSTLSVEITGESRAIDQRRPAIKRFTDEYQQRKHPGDLFFQYVSQMPEVPILWAKAETSGAGVIGVGGGSNDGPRLNYDQYAGAGGR